MMKENEFKPGDMVRYDDKQSSLCGSLGILMDILSYSIFVVYFFDVAKCERLEPTYLTKVA
jgi:hypothetical protein